MKNTIQTIITIISFALTTYAQPGTIDLTFNPTDIGYGNGDGANGTVITTSIQSDGKIIIGGGFTSYNGTAINRITRLNTDGMIDSFFNIGTGADDIISTNCIQNNGKIIIGGSFIFFNGISKNRIVRLNSDGSIDNTFNIGYGANDIVRNAIIQTDGKIIIGGDFTTYNGTARNRIARINVDGTLDSSFNPGLGADNSVYTISIQNDGKIFIGGTFTSFNGTNRSRLARLYANGTLDLTFNPGTGTNSSNSSVLTNSIQSDGKIIIGGNFTTYNGTTRNSIARINIDGTLDASFTPQTIANTFKILSISILNDGKIIIGGNFITSNGNLITDITRFNSNGTIDLTFNSGLESTSIFIGTTSIQSDGKIIIGGTFTTFNGTGRNRIARLNSNGNLDLTFNPGSGTNGTIETTQIQSDGKIIIGGNFTIYNGFIRSKIARLNVDGTFDSTLNIGTGANDTVYTTSIQNDGKIILGGIFTSFNGTSTNNHIARINSNGTLDGSFNLQNGTGNSVRCTAIQSNANDGKIIFGGDFTVFNSNDSNYSRLNADGTPDVSFNPNPGYGTNGIVYNNCIQSDGKIIIAGSFSAYNGTSRNQIARLNANGTLDSSFISGSGIITRTTAIQSDGKIIVAGSGIVRLNTDGTIDTSFNSGTGLNSMSSIKTIFIQNNGKIIIAGTFSSYNGIVRNRIARLNVDGSLDITFNPGTGANGNINSISLQGDGKLIIAGDFTSYNGVGRNRIARINGDNQLNTSDFEKNNIVIYPNPCTGIFNLHIIDISGVKKIDVFTLLGQKIFSKDITDKETSINISNQPKGVYLYKVFNENDYVKSGKLILE